MIVRIGRYGPFVQIGSKDDEEKPKFAGLRKGQDMDKITLDEALYLFNLPRDLGETPEGEEIQVNIGRFGPYVRYGKKFASLKEDDPYTISKERALEVIAEKKEADAKKLIKHFEAENIKVQHGPFGPYITDGKKNASVPKDMEPESLTLEQCQEIIAKAPEKKKRGRKNAKTSASKKASSSAKTSKSSASKAKTSKSKTANGKTAAKKSSSSKSTTSKKSAAKTKTSKSGSTPRQVVQQRPRIELIEFTAGVPRRPVIRRTIRGRFPGCRRGRGPGDPAIFSGGAGHARCPRIAASTAPSCAHAGRGRHCGACHRGRLGSGRRRLRCRCGRGA